VNTPAQARGQAILRYYQPVKFLVDRYRRFLSLGVLSLSLRSRRHRHALAYQGGIDTALLWTVGPAPGQISAADPRAAALQGFLSLLLRINIHGFSRRCEADMRDRVFTHLQNYRSVISAR